VPSQPPSFVSNWLTGAAAAWTALRQRARGAPDALGLLLMVASALAFALMAAVLKLWLAGAPPQAVVFSRGLVMTAVFVALARRHGIPLRGRRPGRLMLRGLLGYGAISCYFLSVGRLPVGDAVLLQYSHPVFVALLAPLVLRERCPARHWVLVLTALFGLALVAGAGRGSLSPDALIGLAGALLSGLAYMTVRDLGRTEHPLTIMAWFPLVTLPFSFAAALAAGPDSWPRDAREVLGHLAVSACGLAGQVTLTFGLQRAGASRATAVTMAGPVFGLLLGWLLFGTVPGAASLAGTALVVPALLLLALGGPGPAQARSRATAAS
jgi:drug/metabolite transporter (DMT)-like permease